ncbi:MAG: ring-cleaving dioxygenase [Alkalilacustris sp.]
MPTPTAGLHHVTAISGPPARNVGFYTRDLGLSLVKRTVNFDDPGTWHLYYGDAAGSPGTILTFFPFPNAGSGREGHGETHAFAYATAPGSLDGWATRLGAGPEDISERFGARVLSLRDPHNQRLELIEDAGAPETGLGAFHSVTLLVADPDPTLRVLTDHLGYRETGTERQLDGQRIRLQAAGGGVAGIVDVLQYPGAPARPGAGSIHHIAFRASDDAHQDALRESLRSAGHNVTPRIDRQYFNAIYFREPGGVLFEIATDPPGFAVDEAPDALGRALKLPPQYEPQRARIEAALPSLGLGDR